MSDVHEPTRQGNERSAFSERLQNRLDDIHVPLPSATIFIDVPSPEDVQQALDTIVQIANIISRIREGK